MDPNSMEYQSIPANGVFKKNPNQQAPKDSSAKPGVNLTKITQMLTKRRQEKGSPVPATGLGGSYGSPKFKNKGSGLSFDV